MAARAAEIAGREDGSLMGLGGDGSPKAKTEPERAPLKSRSDGDWVKRAFEPGASR